MTEIPSRRFFSTRSRKVIEDLRIKQKQALNVLNRTLNAADESKYSLNAISEMLKIKFKKKKDKLKHMH